MRHIHRQTARISLLAMVVLTLALGWLPDALWAQGFTGLGSSSAGTIPLRPGEGLTNGQSATMYFMGHTATSTLDPSGTYDAAAWFNYGSPVTLQDTLPDGWIWGTGGLWGSVSRTVEMRGGPQYGSPF